MFSFEQARRIVLKNMPAGNIKSSADHDGLYLFIVYTDDLGEGNMDPFYSVNKETGEFKGFSVVGHGNTAEILSKFTPGP